MDYGISITWLQNNVIHNGDDQVYHCFESFHDKDWFRTFYVLLTTRHD